jgi:signal transduction histidine kinase
MNDSTVKMDHLIRFNEKITEGKPENQHITAYINDSVGDHTTVTITMPDSANTVSFSAFDSTRQNILIRSVKLIIRETGDSAGKGNRLSHMISILPDTVLLKNLFEAKLGKDKPLYKIRLNTDSVKTITAFNGQGLSTKIFDRPVYVEILNYQGIIFGRVSSQILFAMTLLILTGAAFFFTYRSLRKQEMLNLLRNDFISNISHELRTPVSTVTVALDAIKGFDRVKDASKTSEYLKIASAEMKRLDQLITQALNTSVLESHGEYLNMEESDLAGLTREVLNSLQVRFAECGAKVDFTTDPEVVPVKIDRLYIHGVLVNLLDNSIKYSSGKPEIKIAIEQKTSSYILTVGDNGPGIPEEYISKIFDKFFRVPKGDVHDIKGYGLGLSFAALVMKHHSGKISVRNKEGGGCEFALTFLKIK